LDCLSIAKASEKLFRDGSPWLPLISTKQESWRDRTELLHYDLIATTGFNKHVLKGLADSRVVGNVETADEGHIHFELAHGSSTTMTTKDPNVPPNAKQVIRMSDWYAWNLSEHHDKAPRFQMFWPEGQRDAALVQMRAWVPTQIRVAGRSVRRL